MGKTVANIPGSTDAIFSAAYDRSGGNEISLQPGTVTQSKTPLLITGLAPREREVLDLISEGFSAKEVASKLGISPKTADTHRNNIRKKVGKGYHTANLIGILRHFYNLIPKHNTDVAWLVVLRERKEYLEQELKRTCDMIRHEERRHQ